MCRCLRLRINSLHTQSPGQKYRIVKPSYLWSGDHVISEPNFSSLQPRQSTHINRNIPTESKSSKVLIVTRDLHNEDRIGNNKWSLSFLLHLTDVIQWRESQCMIIVLVLLHLQNLEPMSASSSKNFTMTIPIPVPVFIHVVNWREPFTHECATTTERGGGAVIYGCIYIESDCICYSCSWRCAFPDPFGIFFAVSSSSSFDL